MTPEECDECGEARSPAIEHVDENGERYVLCHRCDAETEGDR